jgi:hypothetical protein
MKKEIFVLGTSIMYLKFATPLLILAVTFLLPACKVQENNFRGNSKIGIGNSSGAALTQETKISVTEDQAPGTTKETKYIQSTDPKLEEKYTESDQPENDPSQSDNSNSSNGETKETKETPAEVEISPCDDSGTIRFMEGHPTDWTNGGTAKKYGAGPGLIDWSLCPHWVITEFHHSVTHTISFTPPAEDKELSLLIRRRRKSGESRGVGIWYHWPSNADWFQWNRPTVKARPLGFINAQRDYEVKCSYIKTTQRYKCRHK